MADFKALVWDQTGDRIFETGVSKGILFPMNASGEYQDGVAWNGLTAFNESPSGAEASKLYADNTLYATLYSAEEFGGTIEAYTAPDEFAACDGSATLVPGVTVGQQTRVGFGFAYRTEVGNDVLDTGYGYKLHLVYGCKASPSARNHSTINDSPEAETLSWEITTTPVDIPGMTNKSAHIVIDSTKFTTEDAKAKLAAFEKILYGEDGKANAKMPSPQEVIDAFSGSAG